MTEAQQKHLEFIQAVISRMANNSFFIRGWSITLVSALFALAAKDVNRTFVLLCYFPCIMFWLLDSYYLGMERKFRWVYEDASAPGSTRPVFSMETKEAPSEASFASAFLSLPLLLFHGTILSAVIVVTFGLRR